MNDAEQIRRRPAARAGALAPLGRLLGVGGIGAPRIRRLAPLLLCAALFALVIAPNAASAAQTHLPLGTFCQPTGLGTPPCEPTFGYSQGAVVDQSSGDVLVVDAESGQILRYHSDGTPSDFSALATNAIDGKGPGGDETPQNGLAFSDPAFVQIAIDNSGTATDGDIYLTQNTEGGGTVQAIDVFAASGEYLGQITGAGTTGFAEAGANPCGVAVDPKGAVYVAGYQSGEIYKFSPTANPPTNSDHIATFTMPAPPLTTSGPCSLASGSGPSAGSLFATEFFTKTPDVAGGEGSRLFKLDSSSGALDYAVYTGGNGQGPLHASVNPADGHVFVTTRNAKVLEYDAPAGSGATLVSSLDEGSNGVAPDAVAGRFYLVTGNHLKVYGPLVPLPEASTTPASAIGERTATLTGTVETFGQELTECFFEYGPTSAYGATAPCAESPAQIGTGSAKVHADLSGLAAESTYHYRLTAANANGLANPQGSDQSFETVGKPRLLGLWAQDVTLHEATLKAQVNPQGAATTYRFEWGLTEAPYEHTTADIAAGSGFTPQTVSLFLQALQPGTAYHYRVLATNHCHPETAPSALCTTEATDHSFTTFNPSPPPETDCPNQALRTGASAFLPDCRAYEMVSPVDKNGGNIVSGTLFSDPQGIVQATADGDRLAYGVAYDAFAGQPASLITNQYLAQRNAGGWSSEGIHPPILGRKCCTGPIGLSRDFIAFSADLCHAWLYDGQGPPLNPDGQENLPNLYRRDNCGAEAGQLETLTNSPPVIPPGGYPYLETYVSALSVEGFSLDGRHALFIAHAALTPDASLAREGAGGQFPIEQIYDHYDGENHLVSVLPDGTAAPERAGVGSSYIADGNGGGNLEHAVSDDGSLVYWRVGEERGRLYLRRHPEQGIVPGECTQPVKACTLPVSSGPNASFWVAAPDGSKALYSEGENLFEFDLAKAEAEEPPRRLIAHHVLGVSGVGQDLSRIYFVSTDALNGEAEGEEAGSPNLYLGEGTVFNFIATLSASDIGAKEPGTQADPPYNLGSTQPFYRATRVTPDGARIVFDSRASLTDYDNTDPVTGRPAVEVFTYKAAGELVCISCNPGGAQPISAELRLPYTTSIETRSREEITKVPAAAWIPTWEHKLHASNVMSADGNRIFFNANDALLPRDTNGAQDVYEWEAPGAGRCTEQSPSFFSYNGGCLYLISSGQSPDESEFWEADPDGSDVFFTTSSSLLPQDPGSVDLYDARIDGGFPQPTVPAACEGEACQSPPAPPNDPTPASSSFEGAGNVVEPSARSCPKGKVKRKGRCVKQDRKAKHKKKAHGRNRRVGR